MTRPYYSTANYVSSRLSQCCADPTCGTCAACVPCQTRSLTCRLPCCAANCAGPAVAVLTSCVSHAACVPCRTQARTCGWPASQVCWPSCCCDDLMCVTCCTCCTCSLQDVGSDLRVANPTGRSPHRREVVLPDGVHNLRGYVKPPAPELLTAFKEGGKYSSLKSGGAHAGVNMSRADGGKAGSIQMLLCLPVFVPFMGPNRSTCMFSTPVCAVVGMC
jgi:hypothetical protein